MSGKTYYITCPNCGKTIEICFGTSMLYNPVSLFVSSKYNHGKPLIDFMIRSKKILNQSVELTKNGFGLDFDYQHLGYYCKKCQHLYNRFYFKLINDETNQIYEPPYTCYKCHKKLEKKCESEIVGLSIICKCGHRHIIEKELDIDEWD